ncbi:MAG: HD domain-containing protein [Candidatus Omnitrophica bacterium]|nr:HD domain-containing protein [Candidatus Omnitrophota bacterium]
MGYSFKAPLKQIIDEVYNFSKCKKKRIYLVGGAIRDGLLSRIKYNPDLDFCLKKGAINFSRQLSQRIKSGFVILDKQRAVCRLVKRIKDKCFTLDFMDFRGKTIQEDLFHRDFTINALAVALDDYYTKGLKNSIIDPYGGLRDLEARAIRVVNKKSFDDDPLRILRAFSHACLLGFKIQKDTLKLIRRKAKKLLNVSFERIRDELFKILEAPYAYHYLIQLERLKILRLIIPEIEIMRNVKQGPYHHLDVLRHSFETLKQLESLIEQLKDKKEIQDYLNEIISSERRRRGLIKLGALLHDIGKPQARFKQDGKTKFYGHERIGLEFIERIAKRLKLSNIELDSLGKMVLWHLRPGYLADNENITPRAIFRFFRDTAQEALSILLLSLADQRATQGPLTTKESCIQHERVVFDLINQYFKRQKEKKLKPLINGNDLIRRFNLQPSPLIGKILKETQELQAIGKLKNKKQALELAERMIREEKK